MVENKSYLNISCFRNKGYLYLIRKIKPFKRHTLLPAEREIIEEELSGDNQNYSKKVFDLFKVFYGNLIMEQFEIREGSKDLYLNFHNFLIN